MVNNMLNIKPPKHPAKFSDPLIPHLKRMTMGAKRILDPFAGVGKIGLLKTETNTVYANELEPEWLLPNIYSCDYITVGDAANLPYPDDYFDCICTSPTYGNRMADAHVARDTSIRNTYTHTLGRKLSDANTGTMQWGQKYREAHLRIYTELVRVLSAEGLLIINVSNHIRGGIEIDVVGWHKKTLENLGLVLNEDISVTTSRNKFGRNGNVRVQNEHILSFSK